jgi:hypothetical protein
MKSSGFVFLLGRVGVGLSSGKLDPVANMDPTNISAADPGGCAVQNVGLRPYDCCIAGSNPAGSMDICVL